MPYKVRKRGNKYRLTDQNGRIAKNKAGTAIDGGGKASKAEVKRQANAIMANEYGGPNGSKKKNSKKARK